MEKIMAEEPCSAVGTICWNELMTRDVEAAKRFYGDLVGWKFEEMNAGGMRYVTFGPPGAPRSVGGMMEMKGPQFEHVPPHWMSYIYVNDVDDRARRCKELGGEIKHPPTDIPDIGRFCVIQDPTGAVVALFQGKI
jgi:predicted enzyme related to lactoylglutathione lyase